MSSHREAPEISKDPVADNTDVYAFVSPDRPDTVTIITNYIPLAGPGRRAELLRVRRRRPLLDLHRQRRRRRSRHRVPVPLQHEAARPQHVPLQHGPDRARSTTRTGTSGSSTRSRASRPARRARPRRKVLGRGPAPARRATSGRARRRTTPTLAEAAVHTLPTGETVFAGQRNDGFFVDLGVDLRPRRPAAVPEPAPDPDCGTRRASTR